MPIGKKGIETMDKKFKLRLGKMTVQEIADWFGVKKATYQTSKKRKLELLSDYCSFEECYGGVTIKEIYLDEYLPNLDNNKLFLSLMSNTPEGLNSVSGMARKYCLLNNLDEEAHYNGLVYRLTKAGNRLFGQIAKGSHISFGPFGSRERVWAVKIDDYNTYRLMTKEEYESFKDSVKDYLHKDGTEKEMIKNSLIKDPVEKAEAYDKSFFDGVISPFKAKSGLQLARVSKYEVIESQIKAMARNKEIG